MILPCACSTGYSSGSSRLRSWDASRRSTDCCRRRLRRPMHSRGPQGSVQLGRRTCLRLGRVRLGCGSCPRALQRVRTAGVRPRAAAGRGPCRDRADRLDHRRDHARRIDVSGREGLAARPAGNGGVRSSHAPSGRPRNRRGRRGRRSPRRGSASFGGHEAVVLSVQKTPGGWGITRVERAPRRRPERRPLSSRARPSCRSA